jgi:hypothetical protein
MHIQVDLTGVAKEIAGKSRISLTLPSNASYQDVVAMLANLYPALVGVIIAPDCRSLLSAMIFNRNGEEAILPEQMPSSPQEGDCLVLVFFIVGGENG